ncbi:MAG: TerB family tellurite resistance protein, partial [Nitrospinales bacterium]
FRALIAELNSPSERNELRQALEMMARADQKIHREEQVLLEQLVALLENTSIAQKSLRKIRNLLVRTIFKPAREKNPQLEKYFKNIVLNKIKLKTAQKGHKMTLSEDQMYWVCLFGSLLALVACADGDFSDAEKKAVRRVLKTHYSFDEDELEILLEVVAEQAQGGFDFHEVVTEFNRLVSFNDRLKLIDCFFEISAADGKLDYEEVEEIRRITKAMRLPHKNFIESKLKYLDKPR